MAVTCEAFQITEGEKYDLFYARLKFHSFVFTENVRSCADGEDKPCQGHTTIRNPNTASTARGMWSDTHRHAQTHAFATPDPPWVMIMLSGLPAEWAGDSELPGEFSVWIINLQAAGQVVV